MDYTNIYNTPEYTEYIQQNYMFLEDEQYFVDEETIVISDEFSVVTRNYMHLEDIRRWRLSRNWLKQEETIIYSFITIDRPVRPFNKLISHKNGHRYYPFHVDVFGISYIDVDTREVYHYVPRGRNVGTEGVCGESFVIDDIFYDYDSNLIAYSGCYWAWPEDVMVGDFANPLCFSPQLISMHAVLRSKCQEYSHVNFVGWKDNSLCVKIEADKTGEFREINIDKAKLKDEDTRRAAYENVRYHYEEA